MANWEYKTVVIGQKSSFWGSSNFQDSGIIENQLNLLGQQGWELISTVPNSEELGQTNKILFVFKRPL